MTPDLLKKILRSVSEGSVSVDEALAELRNVYFQDIGCAQIDHHREIRQGAPEIIFGEGKSAGQIVRIVEAMLENGSNVLSTRISEDKWLEVKAVFPDALYHDEARCLTIERIEIKHERKGKILVISAGTSDIPVAAEALVTARFLGNHAEHLCDVGVAGIHRLLARQELLRSASVLIVVAGMEGALPSVIAGLVGRPVIAVPTSIGYGASFGGVAALLGMLNSCASGVTVVNIDNGFGAACAANLINRVQNENSIS